MADPLDSKRVEKRDARAQVILLILMLFLGAVFAIYKYFDVVSDYTKLFALIMGVALISALAGIALCIGHYWRWISQSPRLPSRRLGVAVGISAATALGFWLVGLLLQ